MAVPCIVAMASDMMNQAIRKRQACLSFNAIRKVFQSDRHANQMYPKAVRALLWDVTAVNGGPGRGLIHNAVGMVKVAHQRPTKVRMTRSGIVDFATVGANLLNRMRIAIHSSCTDTAET